MIILPNFLFQKPKQLKTCSIFFIFYITYGVCFSQNVNQSVISSSGGVIDKNLGYNIIWTLGETVIESFDTSNIMLTSGYNSVYYDITAVKNSNEIATEIKFYPNPVRDILTLEFPDELQSSYVFKLLDVSGKVIVEKQINNKITTIPFSNLTTKIYIGYLLNSDNQILTTLKFSKQ